MLYSLKPETCGVSRRTVASTSRALAKRLFPLGTLLLCVFLAGCGFRPLNNGAAAPGTGTGDQTVQTTVLDELAAIQIAPLSDRAGQQMHNLLRDRLNPSGQPGAPKYELQVQLRETIRELAFESDETATRADLTIVANYSLRRFDNQKTITSGRTRSISSYNILERQFASTISEADARRRTLRDIANDIRTRLSAYFNSAQVSSN